MSFFKRLKLAYKFLTTKNDFDYGMGIQILANKWERLYLFLSSPKAVAVQEKENLDALRRAVVILKRQHNMYYTDLWFHSINDEKARPANEIENEEWEELWDLVKKHGRTWWD